MDGVTVFADKRKLVQILSNLVDNGIKFNHQFGSVSIVVSKPSDSSSPDKVQIVVEDTGIGIASNDFEKLFIPFLF